MAVDHRTPRYPAEVSLIGRARDVLPFQYREFAKFFVAGAVCWTFDAVTFTVLSHTVLSGHVLVSKIISTTLSIALSYALNREWSFNRRGGRRMHREAALFFIVNGCALGINLVPLWVSHYAIGINTANGYSHLTMSVWDWISANVIGTAIAMVFRYWAYRRLVFPLQISPYDADPPENHSYALRHRRARQVVAGGADHVRSDPAPSASVGLDEIPEAPQRPGATPTPI